MAEQRDVAAALRAKLFKILTSGIDDRTAFLSYCAIGMPVVPEMLKFLEREDPPSAWNFAELANSIPPGQGDFILGGLKIWDIYRNWMEQYEAPPGDPSEEEQKKLDEVIAFLTDNLENYNQLRTEFRRKEAQYQAMLLLPEEKRSDDYYLQLEEARAERDVARQNWEIKGRKDQFETKDAQRLYLERRNPQRARQTMVRKFEGSEKRYRDSVFYPTYMSTKNLLQGDVSWSRFVMTEREVHDFKSLNDIDFGGKGTINATAFSIEGSVEGKVKVDVIEIDSTDMTVEFELARVGIYRPWFDGSVLFSKAWRYPGQTVKNPDTANVVSDGARPPRNGSLPLIPTEAVFARNLIVRLKSSSEKNKQLLIKVKASAELGYGPFKISGGFSYDGQHIKIDTQVSEDSFEVRTPQIIGFYCQRVPKAPDPDWSLWPTQG